MPREVLRADDVASCRAILRAGSKSFSSASRLLPARVRASATVLYAFCRIADDAIDLTPNATPATVEALRDRLDRIYDRRAADDPVDRALSLVVARDRVPRALFDALIEGMAWDARGLRYETLEDLYAYAARVAGAVGAMMCVVMGQRAPAALARACDLGIAMQLTNVARDVGEDARRGRVYLPLRWMRQAGLDPLAWLANPTHNEGTTAVVTRLLGVADDLYARAEGGIALLPADCRTAIGAARFIYADIGRSIRRAGYDSIGRRAVVGRWRKVWLVGRALGARWARGAEAAPSLEPAQFLISACAERT